MTRAMAEPSPKCVYVIHGSDTFLRDQYRAEIAATVLGDADPQLCMSRYEADAELAG